MREQPKLHAIIREAHQRGYRVSDDGQVISPKSGVLKLSNQRYPTFTYYTKSEASYAKRGNHGIPAHIFAAYCFFGETVFNPNLVVRHLNADKRDISKSNLKLGTPSENEMDKPKEVRIRSAKLGRAAQGYRPVNAKYNDDEIREMRLRRSNGETFASIAKDFNTTKDCIRYSIVKGYKNII